MNPYPSPEWVRLLLTETNIREYFEQVKRGLRQDEERQSHELRLSILMTEMQRLKRMERDNA